MVLIVLFHCTMSWSIGADVIQSFADDDTREPIHPGEFLREDYMPELGLSVAGLAERLGVTRQTVNDIVRERRGLSPDMCLRLGRLFGTSPQFWMNMQAKVDIWNSLELHRSEIEAIESIATVG